MKLVVRLRKRQIRSESRQVEFEKESDIQQKKIILLLEDVTTTRTGKSTPESDGNALVKHKIDYLPIKVEAGEEKEGIETLVKFEKDLGSPQLKHDLVSFILFLFFSGWSFCT
jgi:hypothetical protein